MKLAGQHVVVVGGSAGIGSAVAQMALDAGAKVTIGSHDEARLDAAVKRSGDRMSSVPIDVTNDKSVRRFFDCCEPFDHLACTAGDWVRRAATPGKAFDLASAQSAFDIRLWGLLRTVDGALDKLRADGSITFTGGLLARRPQRGQAISSVVAGAVENLGHALAVDLAPIRVNVVVPGFIATEAWAEMPAERIDAMVSANPLPRPGRPEEAAETYLSLMAATYVTGQSIVVDGGMVHS